MGRDFSFVVRRVAAVAVGALVLGVLPPTMAFAADYQSYDSVKGDQDNLAYWMDEPLYRAIYDTYPALDSAADGKITTAEAASWTGTQINVSGKDLTGSIRGLEKFTNKVTTFNVADNKFTGATPGMFAGMANVREFWAGENQFSSALDLTGLTGLTTLSMRDSRISSVTGLGAMTNLQVLSMGDNKLSSALDLTGLTKLMILYLNDNQLTSVIGLDAMTNLQDLNLSNNQISSLPDLSALTRVTSFQIHNNQLISVPGLDKMVKLASLSLMNNQLSSVPDLSDLTGLTALNLAGNELTSVSGLGSQTKLTNLQLGNNKLSEVPAGVENLTKLVTLNLSGNEISSLPDSLANLTKLKALDVSGNPIAELPESLKGLENLNDVKIGIPDGSWVQVVLGASQVVYTGGAVAPAITVQKDDAVLSEGADYTVSYRNNTNVGAATGTIAIKGASRTASVSFQVVPAQVTGLAAPVADAQWTGKQLKPAPKVTFGGVPLVNGVDYTLSYGANKAIGKGTVTVTGKGNFAGAKSVAFNVVPKKNKVSKATAGKKQVAVSWSKVSKSQKVSKYEVRYRTKGTSKWTTKAFDAKVAKATVKKLKKGKVYQFQVRSYKTVSGAKYYSPWSATKASKKVK